MKSVDLEIIFMIKLEIVDADKVVVVIKDEVEGIILITYLIRLPTLGTKEIAVSGTTKLQTK